MNKLSFIDQFSFARKSGVPLTGVETNDPSATAKMIAQNCARVKVQGKTIDPPVLTWDCMSGFNAVLRLALENETADEKKSRELAFKTSQDLATKINDEYGVQAISQPLTFLEAIANDGKDGNPATLPAWTIVAMMNAGDFFDKPEVRQGVWNLRDKFKRNGRMLVLMGVVVELPNNLKSGDVVVMEDELPTDAELAAIVTRLDKQASRCNGEAHKVASTVRDIIERRGLDEVKEHAISRCIEEYQDMKKYEHTCKHCNGTGIKVKRPLANEESIERLVEAVKGLSAFGAEQVLAMSLRTTTVTTQKLQCGFDLDHAWTAKRKQIEQTKGLSIFREDFGFDSIGGLDEVKNSLTKLMNGKKKPKVVIWLDEIEKSGLDSSRSGSDDAGTDQEGELLKFMEDYKVFGIMLLGVPGCGKSQICKALGGEFDRVVIRLDLGGLKDKWVGSSQQNLRCALKMIRAVAGEDALWVATSNSIDGLSAAMKSRFSDTFFFDLPTRSERLPIWNVWLKKYGLSDKPFENDDGWVARDIVHCCDKAFRLGETIAEAGTRISPEGTKTREGIKRMRSQAHQRYSSTTVRGLYEMPQQAIEHHEERAMADA